MISTVQGLVEIPVEISLLVQPGALLLASRENYPPELCSCSKAVQGVTGRHSSTSEAPPPLL